jgi:hypothetical protein
MMKIDEEYGFLDIRPCSPLKANRSPKHGVISQKIECYITTVVRASNPSKVVFVLKHVSNEENGLIELDMSVNCFELWYL